MTTSLRLTNDDLAIENGQLVLIVGEEALRQRLRTRLLTFRNEWFLDPNVGIPYYRDVFIKDPELGALNAAFSKEILDTTGVQALNAISFDLDTSTRQLSVTFTVTGEGSVLTETLGL
jgi:hypothetical protein